ncbi:hypothetical protein IQ269_12845 [Tychonema sp. LEGE 07199]|uniref:hypothetical protein n=1 Tax=unclassified Tychonema TaxID=2642144 RepID=UPI001880943C|nr:MULTISPECIES: hypothetical protein [unclassified Tychonema]MBE9121663.1 hypothetical protein [Tychonema sp. LEGE 07199]MBE9133752.1 hypothetical protein [Tychonema sp. LEGE 07196]
MALKSGNCHWLKAKNPRKFHGCKFRSQILQVAINGNFKMPLILQERQREEGEGRR